MKGFILFLLVAVSSGTNWADTLRHIRDKADLDMLPSYPDITVAGIPELELLVISAAREHNDCLNVQITTLAAAFTKPWEDAYGSKPSSKVRRDGAIQTFISAWNTQHKDTPLSSRLDKFWIRSSQPRMTGEGDYQICWI